MKIRTILPIVTSLSALSLPLLAQDAPGAPAADKAPAAEEPAKSEGAPKAEAPGAAAPAAKTAATATVNMGGNAAPAPKRGSLAASPTSRGGAESTAASSEWKTEFHGYFRVPFRLGMGHRPAPKLVLPVGAEQSEATSDPNKTSSNYNDKASGQSATTFHAPIIPDGQYLSWQST